MESKSEKAMNLFKQGYNCSQAVCGAFHEEMGVDFETAVKIGSSFGGGMGGQREVCGAVTGMFLVESMANGYTNPKDVDAKKAQYKRIQGMTEKFKEENPSIVCRELLSYNGNTPKDTPEDRTEEYYKKRPCVELVGFAASIIEESLKEE